MLTVATVPPCAQSSVRSTDRPSRSSLEDVDDPTAGDGQVVVDVKACAVNFPDVLIIQNMYQFKPPLPFSPGAEIAGVVSSVGPGVDGLTVGDRVFASTGWGGLAEKIAVAAALADPGPRRHRLRPRVVVPLCLRHVPLRAEGPRPSTTRRDPGRAGRRRRCRPRRGRAGRADGGESHRGGLERREARALPRVRRGDDDQLRVRGPEGTDPRAHRGPRGRRGVRPGRWPVQRAGAAGHGVGRSLPRHRLRRRRDSCDPAQPRPAQGLRDRRRLLGRVRRARARASSPERRGADAAGGAPASCARTSRRRIRSSGPPRRSGSSPTERRRARSSSPSATAEHAATRCVVPRSARCAGGA